MLLGLLIGYSFNNLSGPNGTIILAMGKLNLLLKIDIITNISGIVSLFLFTWIFGIWGSIAANVVMLVIYNVLKNFYACNLLSSYKQITRNIYITWFITIILISLVYYIKII